jgi:hypothetical protein
VCKNETDDDDDDDDDDFSTMAESHQFKQET